MAELTPGQQAEQGARLAAQENGDRPNVGNTPRRLGLFRQLETEQARVKAAELILGASRPGKAAAEAYWDLVAAHSGVAAVYQALALDEAGRPGSVPGFPQQTAGHYVWQDRGAGPNAGWYVSNRNGDRVAGPYRSDYEAQAEARRRGE